MFIPQNHPKSQQRVRTCAVIEKPVFRASLALSMLEIELYQISLLYDRGRSGYEIIVITWGFEASGHESFLEGKQNKSVSKGQQPFAIMMILDFLKDTHQSSYVFPTEKKNHTIIVSPQNGKLFLLPCITVLYCTDVYIIISFTWNICGWCVSTSDLDSSSFLVQHNAGKAHAVQ